MHLLNIAWFCERSRRPARRCEASSTGCGNGRKSRPVDQLLERGGIGVVLRAHRPSLTERTWPAWSDIGTVQLAMCGCRPARTVHQPASKFCATSQSELLVVVRADPSAASIVPYRAPEDVAGARCCGNTRDMRMVTRNSRRGNSASCVKVLSLARSAIWAPVLPARSGCN